MKCRHFYLYTVQKYKCTNNNSVYYLFILYEVLLDLGHKYLFPYYTLYYNNSKRYVLYFLKDEGNSVEKKPWKLPCENLVDVGQSDKGFLDPKLCKYVYKCR